MSETIQRDQRVLSTEVIPLNGGDVLEVPNDGVPTQVANPFRATLRTIVAVLVGLILALPTLNGVLAALQAYLAEQTELSVPAWVWLAVNGSAAVVVFVSGLITRLLAVPGVNEWIKAHIPALAAIPLVKTTDPAG
jgi:xanthine/uracil/vitamin C permease (AzgA family)